MQENGTSCVAAHSTTRSLSSEYKGPLYQVLRESDGKTLDIGIIEGGYADAAAQDIFCKGTICRISVIYDQSGKGNDLTQVAPSTFKGLAKGSFNEFPIADMAPVTINGHKAYGVYIMPGMEGGLFSGYTAKKNDVPSIDSWRFVSVFVDGGGNKWDLRCCDATKEDLITYYSGIRPVSQDNSNYYPMNKKGRLLLGNGGDNGNGPAGTFWKLRYNTLR